MLLTEVNLDIGKTLKRLRLERRLEQDDLAALTKGRVKAPTISRIETGITPNPSVETAQLLAEALGVSLDYLVTGDSPHNAAAYMTASPYEGVFRVVRAEVRPEEVPTFADWTRRWSRWPADFRALVDELERQVILGASPQKKPHVLGKGEE